MAAHDVTVTPRDKEDRSKRGKDELLYKMHPLAVRCRLPQLLPYFDRSFILKGDLRLVSKWVLNSNIKDMNFHNGVIYIEKVVMHINLILQDLCLE